MIVSRKALAAPTTICTVRAAQEFLGDRHGRRLIIISGDRTRNSL
jgi:hypothetical protein